MWLTKKTAALSAAATLALVMMTLQTSATAGALPSYDRDSVSPVTVPPACTLRLIEPTSPVLGMRFVSALRSDPRDPQEILGAIQAEFPGWKHDLAISVIAYLDTIAPGLNQMCDKWLADSAPPAGGWTEVDKAAIPTEVLAPYHDEYFRKIDALKEKERSEPSFSFHDLALSQSISFQSIRNTCKEVQALKNIEKTLHDVCFFGLFPFNGSCDKLIAVNDRVMSPEVSYPRMQFATNGFTQYVYDELFKLPYLGKLLESAYRHESAWLVDARAGRITADFFSSAEQGMIRDGFTPREALLTLSYSTRNMPSLDWHYVTHPDEALLAEVYFWKFRAFRDEMTNRFHEHLYPNHVFPADLDVYHYATSALQSCEVKLAGFSDFIAEVSAFVGKAGYKTHKLFSAIELTQLARKDGLTYLKGLASKQGFGVGVEVGIYGGEHGIDLCQTSSKENQ